MKKLLITAITMFFAVSAHAADVKIGYVDMNRALNESDRGIKAVGVLEGIVQAKQSVIAEKENKIKELDMEIAKQSSVLNPQALKDKKNEREKLTKEYQRMVQDSQDEVKKKQDEFMNDIINDIRVTVSDIARERGYTAIFEKFSAGLVYFSEKEDLTDLVIKQFNTVTKKEAPASK
ncbi:MAG: OmpH family outer membrane protein [Nitrospiraceae bacterium]|nr:MAG: OmpH family outer membrane protein [Nitrospiraceae bacterium]